MSKNEAKELRLSTMDSDGNLRPDRVFIEFYSGDELEQAVMAYDKDEDGKIDRIDSSTDTDGDGDVDAEDQALLIKIAELYLKLKW